MHNVLCVQYLFLPTEQAETNLKIYVMMYYLKYICPSLFVWKENMIFEETMIFKLSSCNLGVILTDFECSNNNVSNSRIISRPWYSLAENGGAPAVEKDIIALYLACSGKGHKCFIPCLQWKRT